MWDLPAPAGRSGVLSTASGLVFLGGGGGLLVVDAKTGKPLWNVNIAQTTQGSPMTYMVGGKQYIALAGHELDHGLRAVLSSQRSSITVFDAEREAQENCLCEGRQDGRRVNSPQGSVRFELFLISYLLFFVDGPEAPERGARMARRDDREYREYLREGGSAASRDAPARKAVLLQRRRS